MFHGKPEISQPRSSSSTTHSAGNPSKPNQPPRRHSRAPMPAKAAW